MRKKKVYEEYTYSKPYIPFGMWKKCDNCKKIIYYQDLDKNNYVCPSCNCNMNMPIENRIEMLFDEQSSHEIYCNDEFDDKYMRLQEENLNKSEYIYTGIGEIGKIKTGIVIINDDFTNIKMIQLITEKICTLIDYLIKNKLPLIVIANDNNKGSNDIFSINYLAKLCSAIAKLDSKGLLFISVLNRLDFDGTITKFVLNADIIMCEINKDKIIKNRKYDNKKGIFFENGLVDYIVTRDELKSDIYKILKLHS